MPKDRIFRRWYEKYVCQKNVLVIQPILFEGGEPQIRFQIEHHCNGQVRGEALYTTQQTIHLIGLMEIAVQAANDPNTFRGMMR